MNTSTRRGFSLIELLVALSILAVVAAIIVPRFLNVRVSAAQTVAASQVAEFEGAIQNFLALGGSIGAAPVAADVADFLSSPAANSTTARAAIGTVTDATSTLGMGSNTISIQMTVFYGAAGTNASAQGWYKSTADNTAGGTLHYCDGAGSAWLITINAAGQVNGAPIAGAASTVVL